MFLKNDSKQVCLTVGYVEINVSLDRVEVKHLLIWDRGNISLGIRV